MTFFKMRVQFFMKLSKDRSADFYVTERNFISNKSIKEIIKHSPT